MKLYKRYKDYKLSVDPYHVPRKISLIGQISLYLLPGVFVFIFAPAMLFSFFEDWDYITSVYYAFVVSAYLILLMFDFIISGSILHM